MVQQCQTAWEISKIITPTHPASPETSVKITCHNYYIRAKGLSVITIMSNNTVTSPAHISALVQISHTIAILVMIARVL